MLGWLQSLVASRRDNRRNLFSFRDPSTGRRRRIDPLQAFRAIETHPKYDEERLAFAAAGREPETSEFLEILAAAFRVQRFDGQNGLTDAELFRVFDEFSDWVEREKKTLNPGLISPSPTDSPCSAGPVGRDEPIAVSADSTSAGDEPKSAMPTGS